MLKTKTRSLRFAGLLAGMLASAPAFASIFQGETLDKVADVLAIIVLIIVPVVAIVVFWMVHVLPERFAEKSHHPQAKAIQILCLLSLVFGGLLWPIAWLWAYTRPVAYKLAYGTDKHEHYFDEMHDKVEAGQLSAHETETLRDEIDAIAAKGALPASLRRLRARLDEAASTKASATGGAA
ncbi:MAG TPA: DUF3302 domain-containing protein [Burkholderiaceae bacterium]|nr:DUF3302 domain-containing protein [Burkholderiaceae bacterium]HQR72710.1 DUF3302 domain-containing protein [Burkholderiaceae bacterium]